MLVDPVGLGELDGCIVFDLLYGVGNSDPGQDPDQLEIASPESAITRMAGGLRMPPIRTSRHLHSDCPATRLVLAGRWIHEFFK